MQLVNAATPHFVTTGKDRPLPNAPAAAATDPDDALATYSNWGAKTVQLGAPGTLVSTPRRLRDHGSLWLC